MDKIKLSLSAQQILDHKFPYDPSGYSALAVDEFLDKVIKDYLIVEQKGLIHKSEYDKIELELNEVKKHAQELEIENGKYKGKLGSITIDDNVTPDNMKLLKRIDQLERLLFKYGIDPNEKV